MRAKNVAVLGLLAILVAGVTPAPADEQGVIRELDRKWVEAVARKDLDAIEKLYAEDGYFMPTGAPRVHGRQNIREAWKGMFGNPAYVLLSFAPVEIAVSKAGDVAYDVGDYEFRTKADGKESKELGKYVVVWKKVAGSWQVAADIFNPNGPAQ